MAMTDIAEDDLDEMMREEAEDVFYEDGRLAKGQFVKCESRRGFTGGLQGWTGGSRNAARSGWLVWDLWLWSGLRRG